MISGPRSRPTGAKSFRRFSCTASCTGLFRRWRAQKREEQLRDRAHDSGFSGFADREVFAGLFDAAAAIFWFAGRCRDGAGSGAGRLFGGRKVCAWRERDDAAWAAAVAGGGAVHQRRAVCVHGTAGRIDCAHVLRIAEQAGVCAAGSEESPERCGRYGADAAFREFGAVVAAEGTLLVSLCTLLTLRSFTYPHRIGSG